MRLIDADAFSGQYGNYYAEQGTAEGFIGTVGELIAEAPVIDAEPVKHGYWEESPTGNENFNYCSVCCGAIQRYDNETFTYCPHCGARMDGGEGNAPD